MDNQINNYKIFSFLNNNMNNQNYQSFNLNNTNYSNNNINNLYSNKQKLKIKTNNDFIENKLDFKNCEEEEENKVKNKRKIKQSFKNVKNGRNRIKTTVEETMDIPKYNYNHFSKILNNCKKKHMIVNYSPKK